jgi:hypothetical protein
MTTGPKRPTARTCTKRGRVAAVVLALIVLITGVSLSSAAGGASGVPATTSSIYEATASPATLYRQGQAAGWAGSQGLVILDFGRPAVVGTTAGTMDFGGAFVSLATIAAGVESYVQGYFAAAPAHLQLDVAIGTNNSCGTGQPCGTIVCGCLNEPASFTSWGAQLASTVEGVQAQSNVTKAHYAYTDVVTVMAGDDAEPGFDPGYQNTYDLLAGYANAVGGYSPAMVDYGTAEPGFWSSAQLTQVIDGFKPNLAVPEIYFATDVANWASVLSYAKSHGRTITVFGVLANSPNGFNPAVGYSSLASAIRPITGQTTFRWSSNISH